MGSVHVSDDQKDLSSVLSQTGGYDKKVQDKLT